MKKENVGELPEEIVQITYLLNLIDNSRYYDIVDGVLTTYYKPEENSFLQPREEKFTEEEFLRAASFLAEHIRESDINYSLNHPEKKIPVFFGEEGQDGEKITQLSLSSVIDIFRTATMCFSESNKTPNQQ
jgi:hypothetical protein